MLVTFRSKASGDVIMFGEVAKQLLGIIGKSLGTQGIITVEQLPDAIRMLRQAVTADKTRVQNHNGTDDEVEGDDAPRGGKRSPVSLAQRAVPLIELLEYSLKEKEPVTWGIGT